MNAQTSIRGVLYEKNARALASQGGAVLLLESECTGKRLYDEVAALLADQPRRAQMRKALQNMVVLDSAQKLCDVITDLGMKKG